jgi:hypothetical protein
MIDLKEAIDELNRHLGEALVGGAPEYITIERRKLQAVLPAASLVLTAQSAETQVDAARKRLIQMNGGIYSPSIEQMDAALSAALSSGPSAPQVTAPTEREAIARIIHEECGIGRVAEVGISADRIIAEHIAPLRAGYGDTIERLSAALSDAELLAHGYTDEMADKDLEIERLRATLAEAERQRDEARLAYGEAIKTQRVSVARAYALERERVIAVTNYKRSHEILLKYFAKAGRAALAIRTEEGGDA